MSYIVYKHTTPNNKVYIGITSRDFKVRCGKTGSQYKENRHFYSAIQKYGWDNIRHEILFSGLTKGEACKKEIDLIALYDSSNPLKGYNNSTGGESSANGYRFTDEQRRKLSKTKKGHKGTRFGEHSKETKQKISNAQKGNKYATGSRGRLNKTHTEKSKVKNMISQKTRKRVYQYSNNMELITVFESQRECARAFGVSHHTIQRWCKSGNKDYIFSCNET